MKHEGPYREDEDLEAKELEQMEKEIAAEGKFVSIQLPENLKIGTGVAFFGDAMKSNNDKPEESIVFYSLATGILKYTGKNDPDKWTKSTSYKYCNPDNPLIRLTVELPPKKFFPAIISDLSTKADAERIEIQSKKDRKDILVGYMDNFKKNTETLKKLVENDGKFPPPFGYPLDEEHKETYFTELKKIKTSIKLLMDTIDDKLEEKK